MGPDRAVIMPEIAAGAVRGPDVGRTAPPNRACGAVVVQGGARPRAAHPVVRELLSRAQPDVARRVHPESGDVKLGAGQKFAYHWRSEEHTSELQSLAYLVC